jgi:hypothetical protein
VRRRPSHGIAKPAEILRKLGPLVADRYRRDEQHQRQRRSDDALADSAAALNFDPEEQIEKADQREMRSIEYDYRPGDADTT